MNWNITKYITRMNNLKLCIKIDSAEYEFEYSMILILHINNFVIVIKYIYSVNNKILISL